MKKATIIIVLLINSLGFSQKNGIFLISKKSKDTIYLKENTKIKVNTEIGKNYIGKFKIIDENTIAIKSDTIALNSIVKIRKVSVFKTISNPVFIVIGAALVVGAFLAFTDTSSAGYGFGPIIGLFILPPGLNLIAMPFISNGHNKEKWNYKIIRNPISTQLIEVK